MVPHTPTPRPRIHPPTRPRRRERHCSVRSRRPRPGRITARGPHGNSNGGRARQRSTARAKRRQHSNNNACLRAAARPAPTAAPRLHQAQRAVQRASPSPRAHLPRVQQTTGHQQPASERYSYAAALHDARRWGVGRDGAGRRRVLADLMPHFAQCPGCSTLCRRAGRAAQRMASHSHAVMLMRYCIVSVPCVPR